jgi:enamine deaminase RidA (YjgF/YER057c/UK114 family)
MIKRSIEATSSHKLFLTSMPNQMFISVSVADAQADPLSSSEGIYLRIAELLSSASAQIVHERCFGRIELREPLLNVRARAFQKFGLKPDTPVTFVEGESCIDSRFAGVQIRALCPVSATHVRTLYDDGIPKGRSWNLDGSTFYILQGIDGGKGIEAGQNADRLRLSEAMFRQAEKLLHAEGAAYKDVVRTWIYISDILDWYGDFNSVRNRCYSEYGFLGNADSVPHPEQIYLPASTGIEGNNPSDLPAQMDVLAIRRSPDSAVRVRPIYGVKQRSPFRYGSAFSRAMVIEEPGSKLVLVSGTASIDEQGRSVFMGDPEAQIRQTLNVVSALVAQEGATLKDLCEATVFLKRREDFSIYQKIAVQTGISDAPSVNVVADVCRDELLFELDAMFILEKDDAKPADDPFFRTGLDEKIIWRGSGPGRTG